MSIDVNSYLATRPPQALPAFLNQPQLPARHGGTLLPYYQVVKRVISAMHQHLEEPLTLRDMADIALLSPYHFNRIFRYVTGIPPCKFQSALRIQAAKRLLTTTKLSVTEICFTVGYRSPTSFTTSFTELVGLSPRQLRCLADDLHAGDLQPLGVATGCSDRELSKPSHGTVQGSVTSHVPFSGLIMVGIFTTPIPENQPVACTTINKLGSYRISGIPCGKYYMFAAAFDQLQEGATGLLKDTPMLVGMTHEAIKIHASSAIVGANVTLRLIDPTDPPILVSLPFLLSERLKKSIGSSSYLAPIFE